MVPEINKIDYSSYRVPFIDEFIPGFEYEYVHTSFTKKVCPIVGKCKVLIGNIILKARIELVNKGYKTVKIVDLESFDEKYLRVMKPDLNNFPIENLYSHEGFEQVKEYVKSTTVIWKKGIWCTPWGFQKKEHLKKAINKGEVISKAARILHRIDPEEDVPRIFIHYDRYPNVFGRQKPAFKTVELPNEVNMRFKLWYNYIPNPKFPLGEYLTSKIFDSKTKMHNFINKTKNISRIIYFNTIVDDKFIRNNYFYQKIKNLEVKKNKPMKRELTNREIKRLNFLSDLTNRSLNQTKELFELTDRNIHKLVSLENNIKSNNINSCPTSKEKINEILKLPCTEFNILTNFYFWFNKCKPNSIKKPTKNQLLHKNYTPPKKRTFQVSYTVGKGKGLFLKDGTPRLQITKTIHGVSYKAALRNYKINLNSVLWAKEIVHSLGVAADPKVIPLYERRERISKLEKHRWKIKRQRAERNLERISLGVKSAHDSNRLVCIGKYEEVDKIIVEVKRVKIKETKNGTYDMTKWHYIPKSTYKSFINTKEYIKPPEINQEKRLKKETRQIEKKIRRIKINHEKELNRIRVKSKKGYYTFHTVGEKNKEIWKYYNNRGKKKSGNNREASRKAIILISKQTPDVIVSIAERKLKTKLRNEANRVKNQERRKKNEKKKTG